LVGGLLALASEQAAATWSVAAVDPLTGDRGVAVASCVPDGVYEIFSVRPKGVVIAQAFFVGRNLDRAVKLLDRGVPPETIIARVTDPAFDPGLADRQYGVVSRSGDARVFTGAAANPWAGGRTARGVAVQGNFLTGPGVVDRTFSLYRSAASAPMHRRLLRALRAGERAGGDARCGAKRATSAALTAYVGGRFYFASATTPDRNAIPVLAGRLKARRLAPR
jgi:uncharacterized Ntn-hydrolase superfamily protein